ncbi:hypothetical protein POVWA2_042520 [Plasmodium ovale wallikeri]|uniref:Uncharacterized protein n=1 Tax=Plasmodium ovale wallikeri TaxID=864142 RepID=A0A1A8ZD32_PLAOA|nr:hypothetical protein POVWA1_044000 [Plasmodium ovale wallikeri]SBT41795.1 hypothetical protein POVWA2_042520 [Plasmodium ovale wallikeri]
MPGETKLCIWRFQNGEILGYKRKKEKEKKKKKLRFFSFSQKCLHRCLYIIAWTGKHKWEVKMRTRWYVRLRTRMNVVICVVTWLNAFLGDRRGQE